MSVIDENEVSGSFSDSFWAPGQYKRVIKRIDDGQKLCHQVMQLIKERGEIEAQYAKALQSWSKKWTENIEKGPEYGTLKDSWKAVTTEASKFADTRLRVRERLQDEVYHTVKIWSKDNFTKSALSPQWKQCKDAEEEFRKAQKPWEKLYNKVEKSKKEYHSACKSEKSAIVQDQNAKNDSSVSSDQEKKLSEKVDKCKEEKEKLRVTYEESLKNLNAYNPRYMEEMSMAFERCQDAERKRMKFFKEMFFNVHKVLDISNDSKLQQMYAHMNECIAVVDHDRDLKWWQQHFGTEMPMEWPGFEEYSPELKAINRRQDAMTRKEREPITLVSQHARGDSVPVSTNGGLSNDGRITNGEQEYVQRRNSNKLRDSTDSWIDDNIRQSMFVGVSGVPIRALYDYQPQEDDELSFKKGETFEKLEDEDDLGWCKGRKDGKVGLYPANYVELIAQ